MAETRTTMTTTGQYDMLLAMSQSSINDALLAMWDLDGDEMASIEFDAMDLGFRGGISAKIGSPDIQVNVSGPNSGTVLFRLTFTEGNINLWDKVAKKVVVKAAKGLKIAFKVDIALNDLHAEIVRYNTQINNTTLSPDEVKELEAKRDAVQANIDKFGKQAGDFSIQQLFVNFASADISSLPESELVLPGWDMNMKNTFAYMLQQWLAANKDSSTTTLGYGLSVKEGLEDNFKVNKVLIPTHVNLQTYAYKATPEAEPELGWNGTPSRNCLVYCNMSEDRKVQGDRYLPWSGNFTTINPDKEKRIDGTAIIRRGLFLDKFVVPMLKQYNDDMQIVATKMDISRDGDAGERRYHWSYESILGYNPSYPDWTSSYFDFNENSQGASFGTISSRSHHDSAKAQGFDSVTSTSGVSWSWSKTCDGFYKRENLDWTFPQDFCNWTDHLSGNNESFSAVDVIPVPGTGTIKVRGYTGDSVTFDGEYTRLVKSNLVYTGRVWLHAFWQVDIVVSSSEAKGMKCEFQNQKIFKFSNAQEDGIPGEEAQSENFINTLKNNLDKMLKDKDTICQAINDALDAAGKFSHPAAGSFNFKDPVFNNRGDILITAQYKAPEANRLGKKQKFDVPETGEEVQQRDPSDPGQYVKVDADVTAPIGKKGS